MIFKSSFLALINSLPYAVRLFLTRCLILFIVFQCFFIGIETRTRLLNGPLTNSVATSSIQILNQVWPNGHFTSKPRKKQIVREGVNEIGHGITIFTNKKAILYIADACNGLELIALFIGFIISMPTTLSRKVKYILFGSIFIYYTNVFRCIGLILLQWNSSKHFDFAHHYLFKMVVYSSILWLWHFYMKKTNLKIEKSA
jgi:exosortase/archaeosortase family protein